MTETPYLCNNCEDTGYVFDTYYPCNQCDNGRAVQHRHDLLRIDDLKRELKHVRERVKRYEAGS